MSEKRIKIVENILNANDQLALQNNRRIEAAKAYSINLMASPGAGKTSFILATIHALLNEDIQIGVIEGDTAPVTIDSDKINAAGMPAVQVNTGGQCHLDAVMVENALDQLPVETLNLIIVENVGNLICPAAFKLGTHSNILVASIPEGDDKPYKYPNIYRGLDVLIINKIDLLPYLEFDMDYFRKGVEMLNPGLKTFAVSCKTNQGIEDWLSWLKLKIPQK
jgi:hydrogenase nickel incorporation protein HypB